MVTKEDIEKRRVVLQGDLENLRVQVAKYLGALEENQFWMDKFKEEQPDGGPTQA